MTSPVKAEFDRLIPLELSKLELKKLENGNVVAYYQINKPSNLISTAQLLKKDRPKVCLDLKESEDAPQLSIMNLMHRNILRVEAIKEMEKSVLNQKKLAVFVEPHDGPLALFLMKLDLAESDTRAIPSQCLRGVVRQIVDAIEELRVNRVYHGNLTIHNIYYSKDGVIIVKFANFRKRDMDLEDAQLQDWVGLGYILRAISTSAKFRDENVSCSIIDRLASKLESLTDNSCLPRIKEETLNDMFFWDTRRRTMLYIHEIPKGLKDHGGFVQRVNNHVWQLPWDNNPHGGLIKAMNDHRRKVLGKDPYDGYNPIHNIQCMSGAYTHQEKLEGKIVDERGNRMTVDVAVQKNQPKLCFVLHRLLAGEVFGVEEGDEE